MIENAAEYQRIRAELERIHATGKQLDVFGADVHHFECEPPVREADIKRFEARHKIQLPVEYRLFLLHVGNGGAGPAYGLFRLGEMDDGFGTMPWDTVEGIVGNLSEPFPHRNPWNDLTGMPPNEGLSDEEHDLQFEIFDRVYYQPLNGAFPICHRGCALRDWLVVSGPEAGNVWCDDRADYNGVYPFKLPGFERVTFYQWVRTWLDGVLELLETGSE